MSQDGKYGFLGDSVEGELTHLITSGLIEYNRGLEAPDYVKALICDKAFKNNKNRKKTYVKQVTAKDSKGHQEAVDAGWYVAGDFQESLLRWKLKALESIHAYLESRADYAEGKSIKKQYDLLMEKAPESFERKEDLRISQGAWAKVISRLNKDGVRLQRKNFESKMKEGAGVTDLDEMRFRFDTSLPQPVYQYNPKTPGAPRGWNALSPELKEELSKISW